MLGRVAPCMTQQLLPRDVQKKDCRQRLRERWDAERLGSAAELERRLAECAAGLARVIIIVLITRPT